MNIGVIGYLATSPAARSRGVGTRLRNRLSKLFESDALRISGRELLAVAGEVDATNPWLRKLARQRDVLVLDFPYYQPSLRKTFDPIPYRLYLDFTTHIRKSIAVSDLKQILFAIWRRGYRVKRPLDHPAFRKMLRSIEGRRTIRELEPTSPA